MKQGSNKYTFCHSLKLSTFFSVSFLVLLMPDDKFSIKEYSRWIFSDSYLGVYFEEQKGRLSMMKI